MRFVSENDEKMNVNQKSVINALQLMRNVMKAAISRIKSALRFASDDESAIKRKRFNELSFEQTVLSIKQSAFSASKVESKDLFISRNLPAP